MRHPKRKPLPNSLVHQDLRSDSSWEKNLKEPHLFFVTDFLFVVISTLFQRVISGLGQVHNDCIGSVWELGSRWCSAECRPFPVFFPLWRHDQFTHLGRVGRWDTTWLKTSVTFVEVSLIFVEVCKYYCTYLNRLYKIFHDTFCKWINIYIYIFVMYEYYVSFNLAIINFKRSLFSFVVTLATRQRSWPAGCSWQ